MAEWRRLTRLLRPSKPFRILIRILIWIGTLLLLLLVLLLLLIILLLLYLVRITTLSPRFLLWLLLLMPLSSIVISVCILRCRLFAAPWLCFMCWRLLPLLLCDTAAAVIIPNRTFIVSRGS